MTFNFINGESGTELRFERRVCGFTVHKFTTLHKQWSVVGGGTSGVRRVEEKRRPLISYFSNYTAVKKKCRSFCVCFVFGVVQFSFLGPRNVVA